MRQLSICTTSVSEDLSAYMDCMLDGRTMRKIARHMKQCEDCRVALNELMEIRASLRQVKKTVGSPNEQFWADTFRAARLADMEVSENRPPLAVIPTTTNTTFSIRRVVAYLAAACLALAAVATPFSIGTNRPVGQPAEAAESVDIDAIVGSHAHSILHEPLVSRSRAVMIESESTTRQTGNTVDEAVFDIDQTPTDMPPAIR